MISRHVHKYIRTRFQDQETGELVTDEHAPMPPYSLKRTPSQTTPMPAGVGQGRHSRNRDTAATHTGNRTKLSQVYRLLSLFTLMKNAVKGNCSGQADTVLVSLHESLGGKAKAAAEIKHAVEAKLHKTLFGTAASKSNSDEPDECDCKKPGTQEMVVYYLAGYTHKKVTKTVACRQYLDILTADAETLEKKGTNFSQARLTEMREFKSGCLHQPSLLLYTFMKKVEHIICQTIDGHPGLVN
ncbi:hypothetical protein HPB50_013449 [Hyalomma asiaticum]|uniref:Uncharacterized protein n=1 Tax=Hyalomma asiaticum TaxID=266040 RepID=A0ACB7SH13_HYAAI|nr:hypothetical protein HPB50_013449 [Hyalomma asiaticum]